MTRVTCEFEPEALAAAAQSRWPDRLDCDLRAHIMACPICFDVVTLAGVFEEAREADYAGVSVPDAGRVWRTAQVRAWRDAAGKASAPLTMAQTIGFGCAIGMAGACFGASSSWFQTLCARAVRDFSGESARALFGLAAQHGLILAGVALVLIIVPTAVWLTVSGE